MKLVPNAKVGGARESFSGTRVLALVLLSTAIILGGGILGYMLYSAGQSQAIKALQAAREAVIKELEAEGYPVAVESWESRFPPVADAENGALVYERAFSALKALPPEQVDLVRYVGKLDPAETGEKYSAEA